jgi:hypothetical protein
MDLISPKSKLAMKMLPVLLFVAAAPAALCSPGGVLENVTRIQVDPTVIEQPENVKEPVAANLVRYNLRAAIMDARFEEGDSPIRAHIVLEEFFWESKAKRMTVDLGTGVRTGTVEGRLVIQDASGKELSSVKIHMRGSVAFSPGEGNNTQGRQATSDFEKLLIREIESLK